MRLSLPALTVASLVLITWPVAAAPAQEGDQAAHTPVVVAVLDTGITAHTELGWSLRKDGQGRPGGVVLPGYDFVSDPWSAADGNGWDPDPSDRGDGIKPSEIVEHPDCHPRVSSWHGTNVAGTVAARGATNRPSIGIAPDSRVLPVRIMGRCGGNTADVAAGILWAVGEPIPDVPVNPYPARIVNVSLSGVSALCPRPLQTAIDIANERGALVVAAAGSSAQNTVGATPAKCEGVIVVTSTDRFGRRSPTSNYGTEVTVAALGGDMTTGERDGIYSTTNSGSYRPRRQDHGFYQGSSAAAARVSGALALLATRNPAATSTELRAQLLSNLDPFAPGQCDTGDGTCGQGIVNLPRLIAGS